MKNLLATSSEKVVGTSRMKQSKDGQITSSTDIPAEQIHLSMTSSGQDSKTKYTKQDLTINISGTLPDDSFKHSKKPSKVGR